ncbi:MAG: hypothetical protein LBE55_00845 [Clostridiales bacterium]|jgi:hypothetical protein|nr:hypothetical protein [Clostridiales bacterium]
MATTQIFDILEQLSDERKSVIYRLALDMLSAQESEDFDSYTIEEIQEIREARNRIAEGDNLSFLSADEVKSHFDVD